MIVLGWYKQVLLAFVLVMGSCDSQHIELVAETDDEAAGFGRAALREAMVLFSKSPESPQAYELFATRVEELMPFFSRKVRKDAELRLCTLAIAPLEAGLALSAEDQMKAFATTIWPSILEFPTLTSETTDDYIRRLCASSFALDCNNVVPERWPAVLGAKVWRALKSRVAVAYGRCHWCDKNSRYADLVERTHAIHLQMELNARNATLGGTPGDWPIAGAHALPLTNELVVSFEAGGVVTVGGHSPTAGDWRSEIAEVQGEKPPLALHMRPDRLVAELLEVLRDIHAAGYSSVALVARRKEFPYASMHYLIDTRVTSKALRVRNGDTIQILVQALEFRDTK